ncbi:MAG: penicillin-binding transpeptidase domain-containing protein [Verrucomicrobiales bacterium]
MVCRLPGLRFHAFPVLFAAGWYFLAPMACGQQGAGELPVQRAIPVDPTDDVRPQVEIPKTDPKKRPSEASPSGAEKVPDGRPVSKEAAPKAIPEGRPVPPSTQRPKAPVKETTPLAASMRTQAEARTLFLSLPAPRGQIVDRNGVPIAQNIIGYYPAVEFPEGRILKQNEIVPYVRQRIAHTVRVLGIQWEVKDESIIEHYESRRWLPLLSSSVLKKIDRDQVQRSLAQGVILHPGYLRIYPEGETACHIIGSVGKVRPLPTGPLDPLDTFYPEMVGRDGVEQGYNAQLEGKPGQINILFDPSGEKITEEITRKPVPGQTVVTCLDLDFQRICENVLKDSVKRGAFVIVDVWDGDIIAMASWPMFDPNLWVPSIGQKDFARLTKDKNKPLRGRAFMDVYPPASTFKVVTALAGLESGKITEDTTFYCGASLQIGDRVFHNWNTHDEGSLDLIGAIKRSCNTWFYRAGQRIGAESLSLMATRLGYGERVGLPIRGEAAGLMANDEWMQRYQRRRILGGDLASMSIGQGPVSATPLQVTRAMAAIGNGEYVPQIRLVKQIQDINNNVVEAFPAARRNDLNLSIEHMKVVQRGMRAVVEESDGTGKAAANDFVSVAGKTGTAQWGPDRNMAWFSGFLPAKNPQYAFAAIYEGDIGEDRISGGRKVAPMVGEVFNRIYKLKKQREEPLSGRAALLAKNEASPEGEGDAEQTDDDEPAERRASRSRTRQQTVVQAPAVRRAEPVLPRPPREVGIRGFFRRLFGR